MLPFYRQHSLLSPISLEIFLHHLLDFIPLDSFNINGKKHQNFEPHFSTKGVIHGKEITQYNYETRNIDINATFPSFSKLFCAVTGRKPPTGKNNLDIVKANLSRYLEYRKLCEADPSCVKKNAVIVTKIHNPPLPKENDGRGRRGIYADNIRLLLVSLGTFEGKYSTLANQVGVFSRYFDELKKNNSELMKQLGLV